MIGVANVVTFDFDISAIIHEDDITKAQLRIMLTNGCHSHRNSHCVLEGLLDDQCNSQSVRSGYQERFLETQSKIMTFDITNMIKKWMERQYTNGCITLMVSYKGISTNEHRRLTANTLIQLTKIHHKPLLVVYTRDNSPEENYTFLPNNIDAYMHRKITKRQSTNTRPSLLTGQCKRIKYYVDFKRLGLNRRIIAPKGININYCAGHCIFPLSSNNQNHTIHAEIQSLLHLIGEDSIPGVCCTPTAYQPIVLLYYSRGNTLTLRRFFKISVKVCGCT